MLPAGDGRFRSASDWGSATPAEIEYRFALEPDGIARSVTVVRAGARPLTAQRLPLREEIVTFVSGRAQLRGKLVLPEVGQRPHAAVVYVHGSGNDSAVDLEYFPDFMAANGVAGFVFDRRRSGADARGAQHSHAVADRR